jgi:hypothetical protein
MLKRANVVNEAACLDSDIRAVRSRGGLVVSVVKDDKAKPTSEEACTPNGTLIVVSICIN